MSLNGQADQGTPQGRAGFSSDIAQSPLPQVSLPKGGGAVQGIGEKFSTNAMTGTASLSVPVVTSAARSGFGPSLLVGYDSGGGNGIFGVGWSLSLPSITRKTEKGLPRYLDAEESDVFILSGSEDLVPVLRRRSGGEWERDEVERNGFRVQFYRPRIEGLFSRIERWTSLRDGEIHWRTFSKDNVLSIYGDSPNSHIRDPEAPLHVFEWLISFSFDGLGNAIRYEYAEEDVRGVDLAKPGERQRGPACNRYPKRIRYGNRTPLRYGGRADTDAEWMFEVVFDFGDEGWNVFRASDGEDYVELTNASPSRPWQERKDPFSSWRSGFEIRTYRLCRRVLMFHHFPDELGVPRCLVRSTEFEYDEKAIGAFMVRVLQCGYTRSGEGAYLRKSLPPLELGYTRSPLEDECIRPLELKEAEAATLPEGIDGSRYRWVDLDGESIAGVLTEQGRGWYFSRNLGGGRFAYSRLIANKPAFSRLASAHQMLMDVAGSGSLDLVDFAPGRTGFYERSRERWEAGGLKAGWGRFRPFRKQPVLDWGGPDLRFVDLTGDGIPDVLITEDVAFRWHPSLREDGYGSAVRIPTPIDENDGPRIVFADPSQSIYLADMSGDGLADIVRIRNGEVCYWPNRGYGRFGGKIVMGGSPWFDELGLFDNQRIQLADTDGSGTTDILYLTGGEVHVYLNECGNSLSPRKVLRGLPSLGQDAVMVVDFLGRGTACLVFSSTLRSNQLRPLRYVDLMRGTKPHLLHKIVNNLGAETSIFYESSTTFYLADRAEGRPWLTALAFPVHVVSRTETVDFVSRSRLVSSLSYHHGFYDPLEREFRGFGRIDRLDAETFADDEQAPGSRQPSENEDKAWRLPPVETRTWLHTGVFLGADRISRHLAHEYYRAPDDTDKPRLDDTILPVGLAPEEAREACRALKGTQLRQEIYARDGSERADIPYSIAEANAAVRLLQARGPNRHSVFFAHERETISAALERTLYEVDGARRIDPRMTHVLVLEVDAFGNLLLSAQIAYGRRFPDPSPRLTDADRATQSRSLAVTARYRCTNPIDDAEAWRTPLPAECSVHELLHVPAAPWDGGRTGLLGFDEVRRLISQAADGSHDLPFQDYSASGATGPEPYQRMIGCKRTRYRADNLERLLPVGEAEALALPGQSYSLVLTPELTKQVYEDRIEPGRLFGSELGYADLDGDQRAWAPSGRVFYSDGTGEDAAAELAAARRQFFLPTRFRDAFGNASYVRYDRHGLIPAQTRDPVGNEVHARIDYRVLRPDRIADPNGNRTDVAFDALGRVVGTAVMGKEGQAVGDTLDGFVADLPTRLVLEHLRRPIRDPQAVLGNATTRLLYDAFAFDRTRSEPHPSPSVTCGIARETHVSDLPPGEKSRIQQAFCYSDGFGREVQHKLQAEPGEVPGRGEVDVRWVGSGWTIFNNKGKPVRQYEPFFSATHEFEFAAIAGVTPTLAYDPVGRAAGTLNPNHTFEKTVFDPWRQAVWDANDTLFMDPGDDRDIGSFIRDLPPEDYWPSWYRERVDGGLGPEEASAARKAATNAATPTTTVLDPLGRVFLSIAHNRFVRDGIEIDEFYSTRSTLDIQGNERKVIDPLDRVMASYDYDMASGQIHVACADAGGRWTVKAADGLAVLGFDSRRHRLRRDYDRLRRPVALFWRPENGPERLAEQTIYGEDDPDAMTANLRGRIHREHDGAGIATAAAYDFKGNLLVTSRQMTAAYRDAVDWLHETPLEPTVYTTETGYDALNRPVALTAPDRSVVRPIYNRANLVHRIDVSLKGRGAFAPYLRHVEYNARGQRVAMVWGNGATTRRHYDPMTSWLRRLFTQRDDDEAKLQDLQYAYDPVGNVSSVRDDAWQAKFFRNQVVRANSDYVYDAVYRLISATGREHVGRPGRPWTSYDDAGRIRLPLPGDGNAMQHYRENYRYDPVGNILEVVHSAPGDGSWRRHYDYESIGANNRLGITRVGAEEGRYNYDANGNMTRMGHLPDLKWDFKDQLVATHRQVVIEGGATPTTYYIYDASGKRARKVDDDERGRRRADRVYLGAFEIYREYQVDGETVTIERDSLHVMDNSQRLAIVEKSGDDTVIRYQYSNNIGSSCLELNETGKIVSYEEYYPYGATSYQAGPSVVEVSRKRYRFVGRERDEGTGLSYHGARYYAPWLGRWISCDPAGLSDGPNLYCYGAASPLSLADPNGMEAKQPHPEDTDIHQFWPSSDPGPDDTPLAPPAHADNSKPGFFSSLWSWIKNAAASAWDWIKNAASSGWDAARTAVSSAWNWIKQAAASAWSSSKGAASAAGAWIGNAAKAAWNWTTGAVATAWNGIKSAAGASWRWVRGAAAAAGAWAKKTASVIWDSTAFRIIGHLTWGLPATALGAAGSLLNLTTGNILTAVHNIFADAASQWDYATIDIGGPSGGLPIIGNYGGWLNFLGGRGGAVTIGPFVFLEGTGPTTPGGGGGPPTHTTVRDYYATEAPMVGRIYGNQQPLATAAHEKGHTDQNLVYGPLYLPLAIIFSLLPNAWRANTYTSGWFWFDRQANRWSGPNNPFNPNTVINP